MTSGTVFHRTRTPLTVWFEAAWLMTVSKQALSAQNLQRVTDLGSYQTAWTMLHKLTDRDVFIRPQPTVRAHRDG